MGLSWRSQISRSHSFYERCSRSRVQFALSYNKKSIMHSFDSATTLTITEEGYDVTKQQHYIKKRCECSCCDCFHKRCTFRVWQVLLFLFIILVIMAGLALLLAMFGPGSTDLKYYERQSGTDSPGVVGKLKHISLVWKWVFDESHLVTKSARQVLKTFLQWLKLWY